MNVYLDHNASMPMLEDTVLHMHQVINKCAGNPSSLHYAGRKSRHVMEESREILANCLGCQASQIIWTSGGTEANNMVCAAHSNECLVTSSIEHASMRPAHAQHIPVDAHGQIDLTVLEETLSQVRQPFLLSIIWAHNETGVIQNLELISKICRKYNGFFHTDATQAFGKMTYAFTDLDVDFMTISAHKIGGPIGIGALIARKDLPPLICGGGQERGMRAGTQSPILAYGFAMAARHMHQHCSDMVRKCLKWRMKIEQHIRHICPDALILSEHAQHRLPNTTAFVIPFLTSATQMMHLDLMGIYVGLGSACSSGTQHPSPSIKAMGYSNFEAQNMLRISTGLATQDCDVDAFLQHWTELVHQSKRRSS